MITTETKNHSTPAGGTRSTIYYLDKNRKPVDKKKAVLGEIIEFDETGKEIARTYFDVVAK